MNFLTWAKFLKLDFPNLNICKALTSRSDLNLRFDVVNETSLFEALPEGLNVPHSILRNYRGNLRRKLKFQQIQFLWQVL